VAITRAMDELYISFPMMHMVRGGGVQRMMASRFLAEVPRETYEKLSFRGTW